MSSEGVIVYRDSTPVVDSRYDGDSNRTLAEAVVEAVAAAEGVDATDLPPLYETIDLDALERLFDGHAGAADAGAMLGFRFESWNVFVHADGRIRVCDGTRPTDPAPVFGNRQN